MHGRKSPVSGETLSTVETPPDTGDFNTMTAALRTRGTRPERTIWRSALAIVQPDQLAESSLTMSLCCTSQRGEEFTNEPGSRTTVIRN